MAMTAIKHTGAAAITPALAQQWYGSSPTSKPTWAMSRDDEYTWTWKGSHPSPTPAIDAGALASQTPKPTWAGDDYFDDDSDDAVVVTDDADDADDKHTGGDDKGGDDTGGGDDMAADDTPSVDDDLAEGDDGGEGHDGDDGKPLNMHAPGTKGDVVMLSYCSSNGAPSFGTMPRLWRTAPAPSDSGLPAWMPVSEPLLAALPRYGSRDHTPC